jgi:DNA-directed RNA polymerase subunit K/omega
LDNALKAKGAGILRPTASNSNKNGPYKAKKSLGGVMRAR